MLAKEKTTQEDDKMTVAASDPADGYVHVVGLSDES